MSTPSGVPQAPVSAGGVEGQAAVIGEIAKEMYSLRFDGDSYLSRAASEIANNSPNAPWTFSVWLKLSSVANRNNVFSAYARHNNYWQPEVYQIRDTNKITAWLHDNGSGYKWNKESTALFRDTNAWYHIVFQHNNSDGTLRSYVNGTPVIDTTASHSYSSVNSNVEHLIGAHRANPGTYYGKFNGYMANIHFIDGQALEPSAFGELVSDVWRPASSSEDYGVNGFHLDFDPDNMVYDSNGKLTQVKDASGNDNHWAAN